MNELITLCFFDGTESARVGDIEVSTNLPVGSWLVEILNADIADISRRVAGCVQEPPDSPMIFRLHKDGDLLYGNYEKFSTFLGFLRNEYPRIFSFFSAYSLNAAWLIAGLEFCKTDQEGSLFIEQEVASFKAFLNELIDSPEFFSFDFLDYLNTINAIPPFSAVPCTIHSDHHRKGEQSNTEASLKELYAIFTSGPSQQGKEYRYEFPDVGIIGMIMVCSLLEIARQGKIIRRCQNCGKYFIPTKRSDTLYCDNPSPEAPEMTCKQYGTRRLWYERQKDDELATLSRKIASAKGMLAKRNPDIPEYAASYDYFKVERLIWKKAVEEGNKTKDEYRKWLLLMQSQKVIKEAVNGND